jgi:hypothetical protein
MMTTLTELRQHPVEIIAFMNLIGLSTGIVFGAMTCAFGPGVRPFTLLNGNILLMAFLVTYGHLRHSHMWIAFTGVAGRILQSPAHHQLHHSADPIHYDRNLGFALTVWDWAPGTLVIPPRAREPIVFGIGAEAPAFRSALAAFVIPCARASPGRSKGSRPSGEGGGPRRGLQARPTPSVRFEAAPSLFCAAARRSPAVRISLFSHSTPSEMETVPCRAKSPRAGEACCWFSSPRSCGAWRVCSPGCSPISTSGR